MLDEDDRILYAIFILGCSKDKDASLTKCIEVTNREFEFMNMHELTNDEIEKIQHIDDICWIAGKTRGYNRARWRNNK